MKTTLEIVMQNKDAVEAIKSIGFEPSAYIDVIRGRLADLPVSRDKKHADRLAEVFAKNIMRVAAMGLDPYESSGHVYVYLSRVNVGDKNAKEYINIPVVQSTYVGFSHFLIKSKIIKHIFSQSLYENDKVVTHSPVEIPSIDSWSDKKGRGNFIGVFVSITLFDGEIRTHYYSYQEALKHNKQFSKGGSIWDKHPVAMTTKSALWSKVFPSLSPEMPVSIAAILREDNATSVLEDGEEDLDQDNDLKERLDVLSDHPSHANVIKWLNDEGIDDEIKYINKKQRAVLERMMSKMAKEIAIEESEKALSENQSGETE